MYASGCKYWGGGCHLCVMLNLHAVINLSFLCFRVAFHNNSGRVHYEQKRQRTWYAGYKGFLIIYVH